VRKVNLKLVIPVLLGLIFGIALFFRAYLPHDIVFSIEGIKYTSADAYYHMRFVDIISHNFPHLSKFDPYLMFPGGAGISSVNLFARLISSISWVIGLGAPTQHTIDLVGVYFPAIAGALTVIPVYFIGRELFNRWVGLLSAGLLAILPGEFMGRSILGFTDYHIIETLFTMTAMLFLILAVRTAGKRKLTFNHIRHLDWSAIRKPIIYSLLAGFFLGLYILTWRGALLFVFIIFLYFVIQFIIDHLRKQSPEYLCFASVPLFLVALIITSMFSRSPLPIASLIIALIIPVVLYVFSRLMAGKELKPVYYPLAILGLGLAGVGLLYLVSPSLLRSMLSSFGSLIPRGAHTTTIEMGPLISGVYGNPLLILWGNYPGLIPLDTSSPGLNFQSILAFISSNFFLAIVSLVILIYLVIKHGDNGKTLLVVWSLIMLTCNLVQRRFGYYFAVNVALLVGFLAWKVLERGGFREVTPEAAEAEKEAAGKRARPKRDDSSVVVRRAVMVFTVIIVLVVVYPWNIDQSMNIARMAQYAPSDAWVSSLTWLKENTPEPFGNSDAYYQLEASGKYRALSDLMISNPDPGEDPDFYTQLEGSYPYPESAYGVLAWWDYGYWITRIAHRLPNANPSQDPRAITAVASYFTSQDEESADEIIREMDSAYVIIDYDTAYINPVTAESKFPAIAIWAGDKPNEYFDFYLMPQDEHWVLRPLFYPEYYSSLIVRLYNFNGEAATPESVWVISYQVSTDAAGTAYRQLTGAEVFETYEDAEAYISEQETSNYRIVGPNPMISPVPLEALENYRLVYSSDDLVGLVDGSTVPEVKIFEYVE